MRKSLGCGFPLWAERGRDISLTIFEGLQMSPEDFEKRMASDSEFKAKVDEGNRIRQRMIVEDKLREKFRRLLSLLKDKP
jgi:hypothetical protein